MNSMKRSEPKGQITFGMSHRGTLCRVTVKLTLESSPTMWMVALSKLESFNPSSSEEKSYRSAYDRFTQVRPIFDSFV